jgi:cytochrome c-type biogenesis protein CcmF
VAIAFAGVIASSFFKQEVKRTISPGETLRVGSYDLTFHKMAAFDTPHIETLVAEVVVSKNGEPLEMIQPAKLFYKKPQQPATRVAIRSTLLSDLYVVLAGMDDKTQSVTFEVFLTPLVSWLWIGGIIMALGTVIAIWPNAREREAIAAAARQPVPGLAGTITE